VKWLQRTLLSDNGREFAGVAAENSR
jgi:hypothetical protein